MSKKKSIWELALKAAGVEEKLSKISGMADKTAERFGKVQNKISGFANNVKKNIREAANEIPLLGRAFDLISNPVVLGAAAIVGAITLMGNATIAAKEFNHEFLQIKQLNLDKNIVQMDTYKEKIRDASFELGTNLMDSTKAFYDLQSGTGLYGDQAVEVFKKVGRYSIATGANINDAMNSSVKALRAFNMEISDIDNLLLSNAKTVQMGITTFDELAKVQTEYAGAAAAANQSIDTANKLFATFTSIAKNSDVGANMTKTAFTGLKEQAENIKKYTGISVFDNGKMRQADNILIDIARKFKTLNDEQISNIITKIGGPEGLRELLGKVQTGADDLINTFEGFDNSKFNLEDALKNAQGDVTVLTDIVKNRYQTVMAKLGEKTLPLVAEVLDKINTILEWAYDNWDDIGMAVKITTGIIVTYTAAQWALNVALTANPIGIIVVALALWIGGLIYAISVTDGFRNSIEGVTIIATEFWNQVKLVVAHVANDVSFKINIMKLRFHELGQYIAGVIKNVMTAWDHLKKLDFSSAKKALTAEINTNASAEIDKLKDERKSTQREFAQNMQNSFKGTFDGMSRIAADQYKLTPFLFGENQKKVLRSKGLLDEKKDGTGMAEYLEGVLGYGTKQAGGGADFNLENDSGGSDTSKIRDGINAISGGGKGVRNVQVSIGKLIEQLTIQSGTVREGAGEMREIVQEELVKAMQGYEIAAG